MKTQKTLQKLSISIQAEAEEAISALLEELFGLPPVIHLDLKTLRTTVSLFFQDRERLNAAVLARLREGIRNIRESGLITGAGRIRITPIKHEDWAESWKAHFKPFEIGTQLLVKPSWSKKKPRKSQKVVILDPGLSFGTGQHPTTRFCLQQLVACRNEKPIQSFLDIGTGSGILAIAAVKLGFHPVHAFDFDPDSVRVSQENAVQNTVQNDLHLRQQNIFDLPIRSLEKFDVIAANLTDDILLANHKKLIQRLKPTGTLILAGILYKQFSRVQEQFEKAGTKLASWKREKEWKSGAFKF